MLTIHCLPVDLLVADAQLHRALKRDATRLPAFSWLLAFAPHEPQQSFSVNGFVRKKCPG